MHRIQKLAIQTFDAKEIPIRTTLPESLSPNLYPEEGVMDFSGFVERYGTLSELNQTYISKLMDELYYTQEEVIELMDVFADAYGIFKIIQIHNLKNLNQLQTFFELAKKVARLLQNEINFNLLAKHSPKQTQFCNPKNFDLPAFLLRIMAYAFFKPMTVEEIEEIFIETIINLKLFLEKTGDHFARENSVMLLSVSFLITYKMSCDFFYNNKYLSTVFVFDLAQLNLLEAHFLNAINWKNFSRLRSDDFVEYEKMHLCLETCMKSQNGFSTIPMTTEIEQGVTTSKENHRLLFNENISQQRDLQEIKTIIPDVKQTATTQLSSEKAIENERLSKEQQQIITQVTERVNIKIANLHKGLHPLEYLLFEIISRVDLSDTQNIKFWIHHFNQVLIAIKEYRELERKKGVAEDQIHPNLEAEDENESTPLLCALRRRCSSMILALIAEGAQPNQTDSTGDTPLFLASRYSLTATNLLISKGADVEIALNQYANWQKNYDDWEKNLLGVLSEIIDLEKESKQVTTEVRAAIHDKMINLKNREKETAKKLSEMLAEITALSKFPDPFFLVIEKGIEQKAIKNPKALCKFLSLMQLNDKDSPLSKQIEGLRQRMMEMSVCHVRFWQPVVEKVAKTTTESRSVLKLGLSENV